MANRLKLDDYFRTLTRNVYYQPPEGVKMSYPAIRYTRNSIDKDNADDDTYITNMSYEVTIISKDPDDPIVFSVAQMPMCRHNRHYEADGLNHDVFVIYI